MKLEVIDEKGECLVVADGSKPISAGASAACDVKLNHGAGAFVSTLVRVEDAWHVLRLDGDVKLNGRAVAQSRIASGDVWSAAGSSFRLVLRTHRANPATLRRFNERYAKELQTVGLSLDRVLHEGSNGVVFEARWSKRLQGKVAVRIQAGTASVDEKAAYRFCRGAMTGGKLRHPNLLRLFRAGRLGDSWHLIMELAPGGSLRDLVEGKRLPANRLAFVKRVGAHLSAALVAIQSAGAVHRAIVPSAVLLGDDKRAKLGDFALARDDKLATVQRFTIAGDAVGIQPFMSPEQALGSPIIDWKSDQYALGAVLYYALVDKPPFSGSSLAELVDRICRKPPARLASLNSDVPSDLQSLVERAMAKNPSDRFGSPEALLDAFNRLPY